MLSFLLGHAKMMCSGGMTAPRGSAVFGVAVPDGVLEVSCNSWTDVLVYSQWTSAVSDLFIYFHEHTTTEDLMTICLHPFLPAGTLLGSNAAELGEKADGNEGWEDAPDC